MNKTFFYTHLIEYESLTIELDKMGLSDEEKKHLADLVESSMHHTILDAVLSELSDDDKKLFIKHLEENDHNKIWKFLNERVDKLEEKIKKCADDLKRELHDDIKKAHKIKS